MSELGVLLRRAREQRGLTLDDIQESTKIRKRYLEAIESGDHSILPGKFYVRAFVKSYSETVGLDPEEVLRLYQHEVPPAPSEPSPDPLPLRKPQRVKTAGSEKLGKFGVNFLFWSFLILIVAVIWYYVINNETGKPDQLDQNPITDASQQPDDNTGRDPTPEPTPEPTPAPTPPPTTVTFSSKVGNIDQYDVGPAGVKHTLELKISGKAWLNIHKGNKNGEKLYYANAAEGDVLTFDLTELLYVNIGRADYAEIRVDGILVPDGDRTGKKELYINPLLVEEDDVQTGGESE